jgi:hypothetical protein
LIMTSLPLKTTTERPVENSHNYIIYEDKL